MSMEQAPDTSWIRMECTLCHESFGIDDDHRCPRRAVVLNALPLVAYCFFAAAVLFAASALIWAPLCEP